METIEFTRKDNPFGTLRIGRQRENIPYIEIFKWKEQAIRFLNLKKESLKKIKIKNSGIYRFDHTILTVVDSFGKILHTEILYNSKIPNKRTVERNIFVHRILSGKIFIEAKAFWAKNLYAYMNLSRKNTGIKVKMRLA